MRRRLSRLSRLLAAFALLSLTSSASRSEKQGANEALSSLPGPRKQVFLLEQRTATKWPQGTHSENVTPAARELSQPLAKDRGGTATRKSPRLNLPMRKTKAGYFTLQVRVAGTSLCLIIDSGAAQTHLDRARTKDLVEWKRLPKKAMQVGYATTDTIGVAKEFKVGSIEVGDLWIGAYDCSNINKALAFFGDPPVDGALGTDVLTKCKAILDFSEYKVSVQAPDQKGKRK